MLVNQQIDDGRKLLEQLDAQPFPRRFPVSAALWYYWPEAERWRLVIISPVADRKGPDYGYSRIQDALSKVKMTTLSLDDITLIGKQDPEFIELNVAEGTTWPESLEGHARPLRPFEDSYVYRWAL